MNKKGKRPDFSSLFLERRKLGELSAEEGRILDKALTEDPGILKALEELETSDREFFARFNGEEIVQQIEERSRRPSGQHAGSRFLPRFGIIAALGVAAGIAAAILLLVLPAAGAAGALSERAVSGDRLKGASIQGGAELYAYLKTSGSGKELDGKAVLREGNTIQLAYSVEIRKRYGVIFSIDGRSTVTLHFPYRLGEDTRLVSGRQVLLDEAYTLDDAPDFETFFFVVSEDPLEPAAVLRSAKSFAEKTGSLEAESQAVFANCEVRTLTLKKERSAL